MNEQTKPTELTDTIDSTKPSYNLIIESISLDDIIKYDKERFNSNNHWPNNIMPNDYREKITNSVTSNWIDKFHPANTYQKFVIDNSYHLNWMKKANEISEQTGKFSLLFKDDIDDFISYFYQTYPKDITTVLSETNTIPYFVRTENVSLKYGQHGIGPYYNIKQIIESLVSSIGGHTPIYPDTEKIIIYLFPFNELISDSNEFRVFVSNNKITAISQQACYSKFVIDLNLLSSNANFVNLDKDLTIPNQLELYTQIIVDYFDFKIKPTFDQINSYTYDFAICYDKKNNQFNPYFIEPNSFGKEYAAGSALFHWLLDEDKLYGLSYETNDKTNIYLRYVI
jgi:hypothetical protein